MVKSLLALTLLQAAAVSAEGLVHGVVIDGNLAKRQNGPPGACQYVNSVYSSCANAIPGFTTKNDVDAASCLCYRSSTWRPELLDNAIDTCASYVRTAIATAYSDYSKLDDFCKKEGDVVKTPASATARTTGTATGTGGGSVTGLATGTSSRGPVTTAIASAPGCRNWYSSYLSCASATPGFTDFNDPQAASCLCYVGTSYAPSVLDGHASTCASFVSTAAPDKYSSWAAVAELCTSVGDVRALGTNSASTTSRGSTGSGLFGASTTPRPTATPTTQPAVVTVTGSPVPTTSTGAAPGNSVAVLQGGLIRNLFAGFVVVVVGAMVVL